MALEKLVPFVLIIQIHLSSCLWMPDKPPWYDDLKAKCVGAEHEYYVDPSFRRCCKCSSCSWDPFHTKVPDCNPSRNCEAVDADCITEEYFIEVFNNTISTYRPQHSTASSQSSTTTTPSTFHTAHTSSLKTAFSAPESKPSVVNGVTEESPEPSDDGISLVMVGLIVALTVTLLLVACLLHSKCGGTGNSSAAMRKLMHLCKREKPSSSSGISDGDRNLDEAVQLVAEGGNPNNEMPPPISSRSSEFGPQEMVPSTTNGITSRNEVSIGRSFADSSISCHDGPSDRICAYNRMLPAGNDCLAERSDQRSGSSSAGVNGNGRFIFGYNTGSGNITFERPNITIYCGGPDAATAAPPVSMNSSRRTAVHQQLPDRNSPVSQLTSSALPGSEGQYARPNNCFPLQNGGVCVTSTTPYPTREEELGSGIMRRQSSQISSTSNGPVENSSGGICSPKELSVCQESDSLVQHRSSSSILNSEISSRINGPVQHSSSSREPLHRNFSSGYQDGSLVTGVVLSPQSDLES